MAPPVAVLNTWYLSEVKLCTLPGRSINVPSTWCVWTKDNMFCSKSVELGVEGCSCVVYMNAE